MPHGGARPGAGRRKKERPTNASMAQRVLTRVRAEETWVAMVEFEKKRLGLDGTKQEDDDAIDSGNQSKYSIIPLTNLLRYLEDRAYGRPMDTVNHQHDKPLEVHATVTRAEIIREVRERKQRYTQSKHLAQVTLAQLCAPRESSVRRRLQLPIRKSRPHLSVKTMGSHNPGCCSLERGSAQHRVPRWQRSSVKLAGGEGAHNFYIDQVNQLTSGVR